MQHLATCVARKKRIFGTDPKVVHCFLVFTRVLVRSSKRQGRNPRGMASSPLATSSTRAREHPELAEAVFTLQPLVSLVHFGGVGGFSPYPSVQVRKCRPAPRFFTFRRTLMPEFDQPPFYIDRSKCRR